MVSSRWNLGNSRGLTTASACMANRIQGVIRQNLGRVEKVDFPRPNARHSAVMILTILRLLSLIPSALRLRSDLALENLALTTQSLAVPVRGERNRDPAPGVPRSRHRARRSSLEAHCPPLLEPLSWGQDASGFGQRCPGAPFRASGGAGPGDRVPRSRWSSPPL
jgi:hypothetical protein